MAKSKKSSARITQKGMVKLLGVVQAEEKEQDFFNRLDGAKLVLSLEEGSNKLLYTLSKKRFKDMQSFFAQEEILNRHQFLNEFVNKNPDDPYDPDT